MNSKKTASKKSLHKTASVKKTVKKTHVKKASAKKAKSKKTPLQESPQQRHINDNNNLDEKRIYENVSYPLGCFDTASPALLEAIAKLHNIDAAPADNCTYLDIGCAQGFNPIAFANIHPDSHFFGFDLSDIFIKEGKKLAKEANIKNITLHAHDVCLGNKDPFKNKKFDYIICHGVFVWVPIHVRTAISEYIKDHLNPNGIAYISYNALPGWSRIAPVGKLMHYAANTINDSWQEQLNFAKKYINVLAKENFDNNTTKIAQELSERFKTAPDNYAYLEFIHRDCAPLYLHEFVDIMKHHQLKYISDASLMHRYCHGNDDTKSFIKNLTNDYIIQEQLMDIHFNRQFKCSIICHDHHHIAPIDYKEHIEHVRFRLVILPKKEDMHDFNNNEKKEYYFPTLGMKVRDKMRALILQYIINSWSGTFSYEDVINFTSGILEKTGNKVPSDSNDIFEIKTLLFELVNYGKLNITTHKVPFINKQKINHPTLSKFNRNSFHKTGFLVNAYGTNVGIKEEFVTILNICDGRHRDAIIQDIFQLWKVGDLKINDSNNTPIAQEKIVDIVKKRVHDTINFLANNHLLT